MTPDIQGFILIGGQSRRMGRDKSQLRLGQQTFVERIANAIAHHAGEISLIGENQNNAAFSFPVIADLRSHWGALGGIHTALEHCQTPWALIVACDLPFVTADLIDTLARHRTSYDAVVPVQKSNQWQPLCALYSRGACLPPARELISAGERRARALIESVNACLVNEEALNVAPHVLLNVNTPEEYAAARKLIED